MVCRNGYPIATLQPLVGPPLGDPSDELAKLTEIQKELLLWLRIDKILMRLETGRGTAADLAVILEICDEMVGRTICVLADAAAMPAKSIVQKFKAEFERHVAERRCPFKADGGTEVLSAQVAGQHG